MSSVTDNRVNSPGSAIDDRWVFTNRNTGLQYLTAETLAIASRVLKECNPALAARALEVAGKLWEFEQSHPPVYARNAYVPRDSGYSREEIGATAELFRTKIKAVELEAERLQQEAMYELAHPVPFGREAASQQGAARGNMAAYEAMCRAPFPKPATEILLAALAGIERKPEVDNGSGHL